jgi:hypothetical protein
VELATCSAPAIFRALISATSSIIPICSSAGRTALCVDLSVAVTYVPVSLRRCSIRKRFLFRIQWLGNLSCLKTTCRSLVQSVDILCMLVISTHAFSLCSRSMGAAFARRIFSRKRHCEERNVQLSIHT